MLKFWILAGGDFQEGKGEKAKTLCNTPLAHLERAYCASRRYFFRGVEVSGESFRTVMLCRTRTYKLSFLTCAPDIPCSAPGATLGTPSSTLFCPNHFRVPAP